MLIINIYVYTFCKNGTLLFLNWNKNCRESTLKDKRILQILFAGRIWGVLTGKRKSAAAPENRSSSCKGRDSIWLPRCCRDPLEGWFEWMWSLRRKQLVVFARALYLPAQRAGSHGSCCFRLQILLRAFGDNISLHHQVATLASACDFIHRWVFWEVSIFLELKQKKNPVKYVE